MKNIIPENLLMEFFKSNSNRDIKHPELVDWAMNEYKNRTGKTFRDPDRGIRKLYEKGFLIKVKKGVYRYDPQLVEEKHLENFTSLQKQQILMRDGDKCVICGKGKKEGMELHIDHIRPKDKGGKAIVENGQTLCSEHNFLKKNFNQTETGKKMFIRLYELAKKENNQELLSFCGKILETFDEYQINSHIEWKK